MGGLALLGAGLVPGRWWVRILGGLLILAGALSAGGPGRNGSLDLTFLRHLAAAAAVFCVMMAGLLRWTQAAGSRGTLAAGIARTLERIALTFGAPVAVHIVFEMAVVGLLRTGLATPAGRRLGVPADGLIDLGALIVAVCLSPSARRRATPLFWLIVAAVGWSALIIPPGLGSKVMVAGWPQWMPWTLWAYVGMSLVLFGFVLAQGMRRQRRRRLAWPDHLEWLCEPHEPWPGFRPSAAAIAMGLLPLGAYHADSFLVMPCAALAGGAALRLAHRQWNPNFAEVGMALVTLAVVSFVVACVPESVGGSELVMRMPLLLAAVMIGLAVMIFIWQWLPNVWDQQLHDGRAWTTAGRMIPQARRIGVLAAVFGALSGLQLALWPEIASTRDDSAARWALGLFANAVLLAAMGLATRLSQRRTLAGLTLLSLAVAGVYVIIRFPDREPKFWLIEHWPVAIALVAPICLGLSRAAHRGRWRPFVGVLELSAIVIVPAAAVAGTIAASVQPVVAMVGKLIRYDAASLRTATWSLLALHYALYACLPGRRVLSLPAAILINMVIANVGLWYGWGLIERSYVYLMPLGASLAGLAYVNRSRLSQATFRGARLAGAVLMVVSPAWRLFVPGEPNFAVPSIVLLITCVMFLVAGALLRTRMLITVGLVGMGLELAALVMRFAVRDAP